MLSRRSVPGPRGPSAKRPRRPLPLGPATRDVQHVRPHACMTRAARARSARFHPHADGPRANAHASTNLARNPLPLPGFVIGRNRRAGDGRRDAREPEARRLSRCGRRHDGRPPGDLLHLAPGGRTQSWISGHQDIGRRGRGAGPATATSPSTAGKVPSTRTSRRKPGQGRGRAVPRPPHSRGRMARGGLPDPSVEGEDLPRAATLRNRTSR